MDFCTIDESMGYEPAMGRILVLGVCCRILEASPIGVVGECGWD